MHHTMAHSDRRKSSAKLLARPLHQVRERFGVPEANGGCLQIAVVKNGAFAIFRFEMWPRPKSLNLAARRDDENVVIIPLVNGKLQARRTGVEDDDRVA